MGPTGETGALDIRRSRAGWGANIGCSAWAALWRVMDGPVRIIVQRLLFGVGFFFGMFGVLMLIGLSRSPEGFRPAPFVGLVILGTVIMVVSARWQRQSIAET